MPYASGNIIILVQERQKPLLFSIYFVCDLAIDVTFAAQFGGPSFKLGGDG